MPRIGYEHKTMLSFNSFTVLFYQLKSKENPQSDPKRLALSPGTKRKVWAWDSVLRSACLCWARPTVVAALTWR